MYLELLPFAKDCGVKIATENMWNWDDAKNESCFAACATSESFIEHVDAVNDPYLVACLDIGHAEMRGSGSGAANMIRALGHRLQALHIHDNDRWHDSHQIPFSMSIDFAPIAAALKEIGYKGWFTLEADHYLKEKFNEENVFEGMKDLHTAAVALKNYLTKPEIRISRILKSKIEVREKFSFRKTIFISAAFWRRFSSVVFNAHRYERYARIA